MKYLFAVLVLFATFFSASAADLPDYLKDLQEKYANGMNVVSVSDDDFKDDNDNKFFVLKIVSRQDDRVTDLDYLMRVTFQLTDKKAKSVVFCQVEKKPRPVPPADYYADRTDWEIRLPFGQLKRPKLTAYAVEFGFRMDGYFVPVATDYDKVDSAEEILNGEGTEMKTDYMSCAHWHYSE